MRSEIVLVGFPSRSAVTAAGGSMDRRVIPSPMDTVFEYDYSVKAEDMRSLYEKAKRDQWNASRDIAWATPEPDDGRTLADELVDIYGSPIWDKLSEKERVELNRRITAWRLSVLVYGEQGALLACSQLVDMVSGADQKFFQATQVVDEARHNEVLERYIAKRLDGLHYPMPDNERVLFDSILQDESRHMGFGMLALPCVIREASAAEKCEMEDFTCTAIEKVLTGFFPVDAYRDMGFSEAQLRDVRTYRRDVAARNDYAAFRKYFRRDMHAAMIANLARIGLLTERVRPRLAVLGIQLPQAA